MRLSTRARRLVSSVIAVPLLWLGGCGNPVAPTLQTDTFNGTLTAPVNGVFSSAAFPLTIKTGEVRVTLVSLAPLTTITVGVALGTINNNVCGAFESNASSRAGNVVLDDILTAGQYCVAVYDIGNVTQDTQFGIAVDYVK